MCGDSVLRMILSILILKTFNYRIKIHTQLFHVMWHFSVIFDGHLHNKREKKKIKKRNVGKVHHLHCIHSCNFVHTINVSEEYIAIYIFLICLIYLHITSRHP